MRTTSFRTLLGVLLLAGGLMGCSPQAEQASAPAETAPAETAPATTGTASATTGATPATAGAALGTSQAAGPFTVVLNTARNPPEVGEARFTADVTRDGQPVNAATVTLKLSMPSMNMGGPEVTLTPVEGHYGGVADLSMGGEWQADVVVTSGNDTGTATYVFTVPERK